MFLDTEFTHEDAPQLISFGLVAACEPVDTLYVELTDTYARADCSSYVRKVVLPALMGGSYAMASVDARSRVQAWFQTLTGAHRIVTDYPEHDMALFAQWLGSEHWPTNLARRALRLDTAGLPVGLTRDTARAVMERHDEQWGAHNALSDADRLRAVYAAVTATGCDPFDRDAGDGY